MSNAVIKLGPGMEAFAEGTVAAEQIRTQVDKLLPDAPYDQRAALFWLKVGQRGAPYTEQDVFDAFIGGVMTRQPERTGVLVELDTSGPTFNKHDPEAPDYDFDRDDKDFRFEVYRALMVVGHAIDEGADEGPIYDLGRPIGRFRINHN